MTIDELIENLKEAKEKYGGDTEVGLYVEGYWSYILSTEFLYNSIYCLCDCR